MNNPSDPNVTADFTAVPSASDADKSADPLATTAAVPGSADTEGSHPSTNSAADDFPTVPGYRVLREIARGGMGWVLAAFDLVLDRDVALKILLPHANADRFVRESKITARLPHPGIPPVYALGTLNDGSPFLAMKLIAGQTLAEELKTGDHTRLLQAFAQVCQAVGFAHSRGVIHRDLKPANIMVGAFGEVQVMDWGLAKDLTEREALDASQGPMASALPVLGNDSNQTTNHRAGGESTDDHTQAGQVLGTPAYMAPEQARAETTDARSDVFALGGILCAILTGQSPFGGRSSAEIIARARAADLGGAHARLDGCGADPELLAICRHCLSASPDDRPPNGQAVADDLTAYLSGVQERLHAAERENAVALAREAEQRKRRRLLAGLVTALFVVLLTGVGVSLWQTQKAITARNYADTKAEQARLAEIKEREISKEVRVLFERAQAAYQQSERDRQVADASYRTAREAVIEVADRLPDLLRKNLFARQAQQQVIAALGEAVIKQRDLAAARNLPARFMLNYQMRAGQLAAAAGESQKAEVVFTAAQQLTEQLLRDDAAEQDKAKGNHALVLVNRAKLALNRRDKPVDVVAVLALFQEALNWQRQVLESPVTGEIPPIEAKQSIARTLYEIADVHRRTQKFKDGITAGEEALALRREVAAAPTTAYTAQAEYWLAESLIQLGKLYTALADDAKAEECLKESANRLAKLAEADSTDQVLLLQAARAGREYGDFLLMRNRLADAAPQYDSDLALVKRILGQPELLQLQNESSDVYYRTATLALKRGDRKAAAAHYRRCRDIRQTFADSFPASAELQTGLAIALARCGDHVAASDMAVLIAKRPDGDRFNLACIYAVCADAVLNGRPVTELPPEENKLYDDYRDRAMDLLEKLVAAGYRDAVRLATDPDLDPLRNDRRFVELVPPQTAPPPKKPE